MHSMMMECTEPTCRCKVRHYRIRAEHEDGVSGWRCGNCGHVKVTKKQGQKSAGIFAAVLAKLEKRQDTMFDSWTGYVTFDELRQMMQHHSLSRFSVQAAGFGMVDMDKRTRENWLRDDYRTKKATRLAEKTGRPVEASVTIYLKKNEGGFKHDVSVFGIYAFDSEERKQYFPFD